LRYATLKPFGFVNARTLYAITEEHIRKQSRPNGELMNTNFECLIAGIPCIRINPNTRSKGIILLYHGWISKIDDSYQKSRFMEREVS